MAAGQTIAERSLLLQYCPLFVIKSEPTENKEIDIYETERTSCAKRIKASVRAAGALEGSGPRVSDDTSEAGRSGDGPCGRCGGHLCLWHRRPGRRRGHRLSRRLCCAAALAATAGALASAGSSVRSAAATAAMADSAAAPAAGAAAERPVAGAGGRSPRRVRPRRGRALWRSRQWPQRGAREPSRPLRGWSFPDAGATCIVASSEAPCHGSGWLDVFPGAASAPATAS